MEKQNALTATQERKEQLDKIMSMDRRNRRAMLRIRRNANRRPFARFRSGIPTGTTPHFTMWMSDLRIKSALQKMSLSALAEATPGRTGSAFALLYVGGIKNVFDLTQSTVERLLAVRHVGIASLGAVEKYLLERQVKPRWTVN